MSVHATRLYISGPMTGYPDHNHGTFNHVANVIRDRYKLDCFNPAENFDGMFDLPRHVYMLEDIKGLLTCDSIVMLPGWEKSKGALLEIEIAREINFKIYKWLPDYSDTIFLMEEND